MVFSKRCSTPHRSGLLFALQLGSGADHSMRQVSSASISPGSHLCAQLALPILTCSPVYCSGELLDLVQRANIFSDSKTFVDRPLRASPEIILSSFAAQKPSLENSIALLREFVYNWTLEEGSDLSPWIPDDWKEKYVTPLFTVLVFTGVRCLDPGLVLLLVLWTQHCGSGRTLSMAYGESLVVKCPAQ